MPYATAPQEITPLGQSNGAGDSLTVNIGTGSGNVDISTLGNQADWPLVGNPATYRRQLQIVANFSGLGTTKARIIEVAVPRGMKIIAYSAPESTPAINGVENLELPPEKEPMVQSATLTAIDGTDWASQLIPTIRTNYGNSYTVRPYDGKIVYTLNSSCDEITLTLTVDADPQFLPHDDTSVTLPTPLSVKMTSGSETLTENLQMSVSGLAKTSFSVVGYPIEGIADDDDPTQGEAPSFYTLLQTRTHGNGSPQNHFMGQGVWTVQYPEGVSYEGFTVGSVSGNDVTTSAMWIDERSNTAEGSYGAGMVTVAHDEATNTLTFIAAESYLSDMMALVVYWSAVVDDDIYPRERGGDRQARVWRLLKIAQHPRRRGARAL